jgi:hypothetical protein
LQHLSSDNGDKDDDNNNNNNNNNQSYQLEVMMMIQFSSLFIYVLNSTANGQLQSQHEYKQQH